MTGRFSRPKWFFAPWCLALAVSSCAGGTSMALQAPEPTTGAKSAPNWSDWGRLDAACAANPAIDSERCPLVHHVREIDNVAKQRGTKLLSNVGGDADVVAGADRACTEGYQRACLAARLVKIQQKVTEAESEGGRDQTVRAEIGQVWKALDYGPWHVVPQSGGPPVESPDLDTLEQHVEAALVAAKAAAEKVAGAQAQQDAANAQREAEKAAEEDCASDAAKCQADCKATPASDNCWRLAVLITAGDPRVSKVGGNSMAFAIGNCKAGNQRGCTIADKIDSQMRTQVSDGWSQVTEVGDDLVQKQHLVDVARKWGNAQPRLQRQLPMMLALNQKEVAERYCPAKKAFVGLFAQQAGAVEFQKRAAAHCKNEAPHGEGVSGADVTLTSECVTVYATPCP